MTKDTDLPEMKVDLLQERSQDLLSILEEGEGKM